MATYRVYFMVEREVIVDASSDWDAAVQVARKHDGKITRVEKTRRTKSMAEQRSTVKKRKQLSPEARKRLAQNLVKARAAKAKKRRATPK